jgi:hypothetical protein
MSALQREAFRVAKWRGHDLDGFYTPVKAAGSLAPGVEAICRRCGMTVDIFPGYSYEIMGDGVALNCPGS